MAILKKGSRPLCIDGVYYRWRIRKYPTYAQGNEWSGINVAVEQENVQSGTVLVIELQDRHPSSWLTQSPPAKVTPSDVERFIRTALELGWRPDLPGKTFIFQPTSTMSDGGVEQV